MARSGADALRARGQGIDLFELVGFSRTRLAGDVLLGLVLVPVSLVFIFGGVYAAGWLVYGTLTPPLLFGSLPFPAALYGLLVWPFIWRLTEQMTYDGYLAPRLLVLCRSTTLAVVFVAFALMDGAGVLIGMLQPPAEA